MKKTVFSVMAMIFALCMVSAAGAYSVTITDPAGDQIGQSGFDIFSITYNVGSDPVAINIATNYPQAGILVGAWQTRPADLLLDGTANGTGWDYAIPLVDHDGFTAGQIYSINTMYLSDDMAPAGGGYDYNHGFPVWLKTGTAIGLGGSWAWQVAGGNPDYNIASLNTNWYWNDAGGTDLMIAGWAGGTCANDIIDGHSVPEPATLLLLGFGLCGISLVGRKNLRMKK